MRSETFAEHKSLQSLRQQNVQALAEREDRQLEARQLLRRNDWTVSDSEPSAQSPIRTVANPVGEGKERFMDQFDHDFVRGVTRTKLVFVQKAPLFGASRSRRHSHQACVLKRTPSSTSCPATGTGTRYIMTQTLLTTRPMSFRCVYLDDSDWATFVDFIHCRREDMSP